MDPLDSSALSAEALPQRPDRPSVLPGARAAFSRVAASLVVGVFGKLFLDSERWGLSFPLLIAALLGALLLLGGREGWQRARSNAWLATAVLVFSGFVAVRMCSWLTAFNVLTSVGLLLWLVHRWKAAQVLEHALNRPWRSQRGDAEVAPAQPWLEFPQALALILLVDVLLLVFAGRQAVSVFREGVSPWAHRECDLGFLLCLGVSAATLALASALVPWTRRVSPRDARLFRLGISGMVPPNLVLLASAWRCMASFEGTFFDESHLLLLGQFFTYALGAALIWRAVTVWWRPERFALGVLLTALGTLLALNLANPDAIIAPRMRWFAVGMDFYNKSYLGQTSADAAPELLQNPPPDSPFVTKTEAQHFAQQLGAERGWTEWNLADWRARRALKDVGSLE